MGVLGRLARLDRGDRSVIRNAMSAEDTSKILIMLHEVVQKSACHGEPIDPYGPQPIFSR